MSCTLPGTVQDPALDLLRDADRELEAEILGHQRCIETANAKRELLRELIATLSKKPKQRKPRGVDFGPVDTGQPIIVGTQAPSVFAPCVTEADQPDA